MENKKNNKIFTKRLMLCLSEKMLNEINEYAKTYELQKGTVIREAIKYYFKYFKREI